VETHRELRNEQNECVLSEKDLCLL
jgi:hypothetical protein